MRVLVKKMIFFNYYKIHFHRIIKYSRFSNFFCYNLYETLMS
jgi:hypothetical protein